MPVCSRSVDVYPEKTWKKKACEYGSKKKKRTESRISDEGFLAADTTTRTDWVKLTFQAKSVSSVFFPS